LLNIECIRWCTFISSQLTTIRMIE